MKQNIGAGYVTVEPSAPDKSLRGAVAPGGVTTVDASNEGAVAFSSSHQISFNSMLLSSKQELNGIASYDSKSQFLFIQTTELEYRFNSIP